MQIPLIGAGLKSKSAVVSAQRRLNCYLEPQRDQDKSSIVVYGRQGLISKLDLGAQRFRGGISLGNLLYLVQGSVFWEINNAFVNTDRNAASRLTTTAGNTDAASNETTIVLTDGSNMYQFDTSTLVFTQVGSALFASPQTVTYQDGFYLATFDEQGTNKKRCQISADGLTWNALDFRAIDTVRGALIRTLSFNGEVHQFSDKGLEFWAFTGDPVFPFQPIRGASLPIGLAARWSIAQGDSLFFLGRDRSGSGVQAYELAGHQIRSIGTPDWSNEINSYLTTGDAIGHFVNQDEHDYYVLHFPSAGKTWVYDAFASEVIGTPVWSEWQTNGGRYVGEYQFSLVNRAYVSDYNAGKLYLIDPMTFTDNGVTMRREVDTRHFFKDYDYVTVDEFVVDMETGVGIANGQGSDPQVMLQISRDGGRTWGAEIWMPLGKVGEYKKRVATRRIGTARDFVFRVAMTDPVQFVIAGMGLRASVNSRQQAAA